MCNSAYVISIGYKKVKKSRMEIYRFGIVGIVGFCINYSTLVIAHNTGIVNKFISELLAIIVALQFTFVLHNAWTYNHKTDQKYSKRVTSRYFSYIASSFVGSLITLMTYVALYGMLDRLMALALSAGMGMCWNFVLNKYIIWKKISHVSEQ